MFIEALTVSHLMGLSEPAVALIFAGFFASLIALFVLLMYIDGKRNARKSREKEQLLRAFRPSTTAQAHPQRIKDKSFTLEA
jgi:hypothetical protein